MQEEVKGFFSSLNACLSLVVKKKTLAEVMVLHYLRWKRLSVVARWQEDPEALLSGRRAELEESPGWGGAFTEQSAVLPGCMNLAGS